MKNLQRFGFARRAMSLAVAVLIVGTISYSGVRTYQDSHAASGPTIYLNPSSGTLTSGSTVSVTVREDSGSDPVNSMQASIKYDSNAFQYSSIVEGGAFPVIAANSTGTPGVIRIGRATADNPLTGDQPVVTINFKVIGTSGSAAITVEKTNSLSLLVRSTDNKDILQSVGNTSFTISSGSVSPPAPSPAPTASPAPTPTPSPSSNGKPVLYISPASGAYPSGANLSAAIRLNGYTNSITTIQAVVGYPANQLQYVGVSEGGVFTTQQRTKNTNGTIDIIRAMPGGSGGKQGDNLVVTVNFKVIGSSGAAALTFGSGSAVYDDSSSGTSILDLASSAGASYTLAAAGSIAPPPASPPASNTSPSGSTKKIISASQGLTITSGSGGQASLSTSGTEGTATELAGKVTLAPVTTTVNTAISKVEYYLDAKLISTQKTAPYSFAFDTTKLRNGTYLMTIKTTYANGTVDTKTEKLLVKNKVTLFYVMRHYAPNALVLIAILAVCAVLVWRLVIPRFAYARNNQPEHSTDYDALYGMGKTVNPEQPTMDDPVVIAPNSPATETPAADNSLVVDTAVRTTPSLLAEPTPAPSQAPAVDPVHNGVTGTPPAPVALTAPTSPATPASAAFSPSEPQESSLTNNPPKA